MRIAAWIRTSVAAIALAGLALAAPAWAQRGWYGGYRGGYGYYGGRGYGGWGYSPYGNGYGYRRYGSPYYGYGYGLGYSPYYYGYGYGNPYLGYGLWYGSYGYGYPYFGYSSGYSYPYYDYGYTYVPSTVPSTAAEESPSASDYIAAGSADFRAGRYNVALKEWEHAMVDNPQNGELVLLTAQALFAVGKYDEAAGAVQHGMSMLPENQWGSVVSNYRNWYDDTSDYTAQLKALEAASKQKDSAAMEFLLGYHYGYLGYPREAVRELDKALSLNPQDQTAAKLKQIMAAKFPGASTSAAN